MGRYCIVIFGGPGSVLRERESLLAVSQRLPHFFNNSSNAERSGLGGGLPSLAHLPLTSDGQALYIQDVECDRLKGSRQKEVVLKVQV